LEKRSASEPVNMLSVRALEQAVWLLKEDDLAQRTEQILRRMPDRAFYAGLISNVELPNDFPDRMRRRPTRGELEQEHPIRDRDAKMAAIYRLAPSSRHIQLCLEERYDEAEAMPGDGVILEEVGNTLAVLGEFERAYAIATGSKLERSRRRGILLVLVIELFLAGEGLWSRELLAELEAGGLDEWSRVHLALGFVGREPWRVYPFVDW
jgi:hypothetical protein